jgi:CRP-like cAMP-binding protein
LDSRTSFTSNLLLSLVEKDDLGLLRPHLTRVELGRGERLVVAGEPIEHIYFPEGGVATVVSTLPESGSTEVGIFGRDGLSGFCALMGAECSRYDTVVQVDGATGLRIDTSTLVALTEESSTLRALLKRYVQTFIVQLAQGIVCHVHHQIEARVARWLLMCHDRIDGDEIMLTHDFISMMVGAQRTSITVSLHILEGVGMIRAQRARVTITDRAKLEDIAGEAYGLPEAEYRRLLGPLGRTAGEASDRRG